MNKQSQMHLGMVVLAAGNHLAGWRMPDAEFGSENFPLIQRVAEAAERAKFDLVFFADAVNTGPGTHPSSLVRLEPLTLLGALSKTTSRIGLVATASTTYSEPYNIARSFASLDHLSQGRVGWNVVTGFSPDAAANFSRDKHPPHAERYAMAAEYISVVQGLWDSWQDGAIVGDKAGGVFADTSKMHVLDHQGTFYKVRGPLNITRPPQGHPVIFQAGASVDGRGLAAATADVVFTAQLDLDEAIAFSEDLARRCEAVGRSRRDIRILAGVSPIVAETPEAAKAKIAELASLADPDTALRILSDRLGFDLSTLPLDAPVPEVPAGGGLHGHAVTLASMARRNNMTIRELRDYAAVSVGHRLVFGTPEQVADGLQEWFDTGAVDGFLIMPSHFPGPAELFADKVVPLLVKRGLFRSDYAGSTLREHLGLPVPGHPAAGVAGA